MNTVDARQRGDANMPVYTPHGGSASGDVVIDQFARKHSTLSSVARCLMVTALVVSAGAVAVLTLPLTAREYMCKMHIDA